LEKMVYEKNSDRNIDPCSVPNDKDYSVRVQGTILFLIKLFFPYHLKEIRAKSCGKIALVGSCID
jgi:hypothetical protein